jgi:hypothetical protein
MKNPTTIKSAFLITTLIVLTLVVIGIGSVRARFSNLQNHDDVEVRDALRRGGLREAAKLKGHYVGEFDPHWDFSQLGVELLTKNSALVIIGTPTKQLAGRLTPDGQVILTDYEVKVQETIKGGIEPGRTITVSLVGGRVVFEDGTSAELKTPSFEHMKTGGTYTLFLTESVSADTPPGGYTLTGGPQGLVEIVENTRVKSHGRATDPIAQESKDKDKDTFLKEVRKQAKKWPRPGRCCS